MHHHPFVPWPRSITCVAAGLLTLTLLGCAADVKERHYFASFKTNERNEREPVQFYRLSIKGNVNLSNARYLSGFFDERAVSLFFNEMRAPSGQRLFDETRRLPGAPAGSTLEPLSPQDGKGAYVLILSTNADSVANAIGSFAESQVVADALSLALNKDKVVARQQSDAELQTSQLEGKAVFDQIVANVNLAADEASTTSAATKRTAYLRALNVIARGLGYQGPYLADIAAARAWFTSQSKGD